MCNRKPACAPEAATTPRRIALLATLFIATSYILIVSGVSTDPARYAGSFSIAAMIALACGVGLVWLPKRDRNAQPIAVPVPTALPPTDARTQRVQQLFEFSQTIQGAGNADQVYASLAYYLQTELQLAGLTILASEADAMPATSIKTSWPASLLRADRPFADNDCSQCPSLRQNLPRQFKPTGCPVRCAIDECITLGADHAAYCVPFNIGRKTQVVCHLLLPPTCEWSDDSRQLAQTYVNTAAATLVSLHLLAEAEKQSMTDPLTGLYNRRSMDNLMAREVALSERHGNPLTLVIIDMDHFKQINDTHGHAAGDHLLKAFADCVNMTLRKTDLAFRYGGDEFVVALPQTSITMAQQCVQKLRQAFAAIDFESAIAHLDHTPTLSIGLAERCKEHGVLSVQQMLAAADLALYDAKAANRNCVKIFTPPQQAA